MNPYVTWAFILGAVLGAGLWIVLVRHPRMRTLRFADRIAPQLRSGALSVDEVDSRYRDRAFGPLGTIFEALFQDLVTWVNRINPMSARLSTRLIQAGVSMTPTEFRVSQIVWGAAGLFAAVAWSLIASRLGEFNWLVSLILIVVATVCGYALREWYLGEQIQRRRRRILAEFPAIAELMALAVAAGESIPGAIERIARTAEGEMAGEFRTTLAGLRSGEPLSKALAELAVRVDLSAMSRFAEALTVAVERGTPVADVVRAQAQDVRDAAKRELMESAGKKEIGMLVPVVFGVLPLTVAFAVFPGLALIDINL